MKTPAKKKAVTRGQRVNMRVTTAESNKVKKAAKKAGLSVSDWARDTLMVACAQ